MGEAQLVDSLAKAVTAQFEFLGKVVDQSAFLVYQSTILPAQIAQQAYIQRLLNSLPTFRNPYTGLYDAQLRRQEIIIYAILGLLGLMVIISVFRQRK